MKIDDLKSSDENWNTKLDVCQAVHSFIIVDDYMHRHLNHVLDLHLCNLMNSLTQQRQQQMQISN